MRKLLLACLLLLCAQPAVAQQRPTWNGANFIVNGATSNGCNIETPRGGELIGLDNPVVVMINRGQTRIHIFVQLFLTGPAMNWSSPPRPLILHPNATTVANLNGATFSGSAADTRLTVDIRNCVTG